MKPLYFTSIISTFVSLFISISIAASGLHFSVKVNTTTPKEFNNKVDNYSIIKQTNEYIITGSFQQYVQAMKAKQDIQSEGYSSLEILAYFNHSLITIEDAFALMDNRNLQDQKSMGKYFTEEELASYLKEVQNYDFFYTVQMGIFDEENVNAFFDFPKQQNEQIESKGHLRYTYGTFTKISEAEEALKLMKEHGLEDAFIIAFDDLDRIPLSRAIEKEEITNKNLNNIKE